MFVCIRMFVFVCVCVHMFVCVCVRICMYVCICVCTYVYVCVSALKAVNCYWLSKFYNFYMAVVVSIVSRHGLTIEAHHRLSIITFTLKVV